MCIKATQRGNFGEAAGMFHYPPFYSSEELIRDRAGVESSLSELSKLFGTFERVEPLQRSVSFYKLDIGSGDIGYWKKYPESVQVKYETRFSNEGEGFIILTVVRISEKLELRSVAFGIPAESPNAKERMGKIAEHMLNMMKNRATEPREERKI
jgi:hypothetical protein